MPDLTRISAPPVSRREQILAAAATLFAERGFHGVSVYDVGKAVGISGAALYKHFASKEALLGELLIGISEHLLAVGRERSAEAAAEGPDAVLSSLVGWHVEFALAHPALITVQLRDLSSLAETDREAVRRLQRRYVELWVGAVCAAFDVDVTRARAAAHATFGLINSTPHSARLGIAEMTELLHRMALGALGSAVR
ncbi:MAG TPA: TetR/AcrR family transcriptional regulator [Microlunatus sp.]|nr:TetR/AcrR family transcriptional regulator [Microlunatus sp.]